MAQIIPAILEQDIDRFNEKLAVILKIPDVQRIQVDFSDGIFTDYKTVQPNDLDLLSPAYSWEAHLMVQNPSEYFFDLKVAGFNNALIHYEAVPEQKLPELAEELKKLNLTCSLAINPETEVDKILPMLSLFESVTIMGVHPGHQGQHELSDTADKVKKLRNASKNVIIQVDGGVKMDNISELFAAGADRFIANSALFEPGEENLNPAQNYERLKQKIK